MVLRGCVRRTLPDPLLQNPPCSAFRGPPSILPLQGGKSFPPLCISDFFYFFFLPPSPTPWKCSWINTQLYTVEAGDGLVPYSELFLVWGIILHSCHWGGVLPRRGAAGWARSRASFFSLLLFPAGERQERSRDGCSITQGRARTLLRAVRGSCRFLL